MPSFPDPPAPGSAAPSGAEALPVRSAEAPASPVETTWEEPLEAGRPPCLVLPGLWLFPPNRDSQGGSAWLLESRHGDVLVDCPPLTESTLQFLLERSRSAAAGRGGRLVLTGRHGHGRCRALQQRLGWPVLVQEQEAYLLPGVEPLIRFGEVLELAEELRLLWTPGPSPGSCVLHAGAGAAAAGDGLFCGRLLVPVGPRQLAPLRRRGTFHWPRQLRSLEQLRANLPAGSPAWIATGAALGGLRGERIVADGASLLHQLDLDRFAACEAIGEP